MMSPASVGMEFINVMMSAIAYINPGSTTPNIPAISIRVISSPARSEITGIGAVSTSTIGCMGSVIVCICSKIGERKSEKNEPRFNPTSLK